MTRAEILRHLEADATTGYPQTLEAIRPLPDAARAAHAIGYVLRHEIPLPAELAIAIRRVLVTLLEAD